MSKARATGTGMLGSNSLMLVAGSGWWYAAALNTVPVTALGVGHGRRRGRREDKRKEGREAHRGG